MTSPKDPASTHRTSLQSQDPASTHRIQLPPTGPASTHRTQPPLMGYSLHSQDPASTHRTRIHLWDPASTLATTILFLLPSSWNTILPYLERSLVKRVSKKGKVLKITELPLPSQTPVMLSVWLALFPESRCLSFLSFCQECPFPPHSLNALHSPTPGGFLWPNFPPPHTPD